jgi:hypothetical protein
VVDAVVPAGRAVDALDCGPLVRAFVDRVYGGRVRPLGVSDDAASVRRGVDGAQDRLVAGGGWAPVNGATGSQQLADGLTVGSTVVVMTSPLRGDICHVVAAHVTIRCGGPIRSAPTSARKRRDRRRWLRRPRCAQWYSIPKGRRYIRRHGRLSTHPRTAPCLRCCPPRWTASSTGTSPAASAPTTDTPASPASPARAVERSVGLRR